MKTLKDLKPFDQFDRNKFSVRQGIIELVSKEDLKQEAINWIKHIEEDIEEVRELQGKMIKNPLSKIVMGGLDEILDGQITWIKLFFDITEDDLK